MPLSFPSRPLLALPLMAPLFGCASKPAEPPIVLRTPPPAAKTEVHRPPRSKQETRTVSAPANRTPASATAEPEAPPASGSDVPPAGTDVPSAGTDVPSAGTDASSAGAGQKALSSEQ